MAGPGQLLSAQQCQYLAALEALMRERAAQRGRAWPAAGLRDDGEAEEGCPAAGRLRNLGECWSMVQGMGEGARGVEKAVCGNSAPRDSVTRESDNSEDSDDSDGSDDSDDLGAVKGIRRQPDSGDGHGYLQATEDFRRSLSSHCPFGRRITAPQMDPADGARRRRASAKRRGPERGGDSQSSGGTRLRLSAADHEHEIPLRQVGPASPRRPGLNARVDQGRESPARRGRQGQMGRSEGPLPFASSVGACPATRTSPGVTVTTSAAQAGGGGLLPPPPSSPAARRNVVTSGVSTAPSAATDSDRPVASRRAAGSPAASLSESPSPPRLRRVACSCTDIEAAAAEAAAAAKGGQGGARKLEMPRTASQPSLQRGLDDAGGRDGARRVGPGQENSGRGSPGGAGLIPGAAPQRGQAPGSEPPGPLHAAHVPLALGGSLPHDLRPDGVRAVGPRRGAGLGGRSEGFFLPGRG